MGYWICMLIVSLVIPGIMVGFGSHPPRKNNAAYGYRTARSRKNDDTWAFAQEYSCARMRRWGLILLPVSVVVMLLCLRMTEDTLAWVLIVLIVVQFFPLIGTIIATERALRNTFDDEGRRK